MWVYKMHVHKSSSWRYILMFPLPQLGTFEVGVAVPRICSQPGQNCGPNHHSFSSPFHLHCPAILADYSGSCIHNVLEWTRYEKATVAKCCRWSYLLFGYIYCCLQTNNISQRWPTGNPTMPEEFYFSLMALLT